MMLKNKEKLSFNMVGLISLSSGSQGNAVLIKNNDEAILIDCGLSCKKLREKLAEAEVDESMLSAIFVTHEHSDHVSGLRVTADKLGIPAYSNQNTGAFLSRKNRAPKELIFFENGHSINHGSFLVEPFSVPHDGVDTVAFTVNCGSKRITVATDFGYPSQLVRQKIKESDILFLEANHDVKMLQECDKRPWKVKQRILSRHGHLSNESCFDLLSDALHQDLKQLVLGHVSQDTNDYALVEDLTAKYLEESGYSGLPFFVAKQEGISPFFSV